MACDSLRVASVAAGLLAGLCVSCGREAGPVYTFEQTESSHAGYRRTKITSGGAVYVNDFEEYSLRLANPEPTQVVGRSKFGNGKICAIPGQSPSAYLAADVGSEMPAYEVFRNIQQPVFDWRQATFQSMRFGAPDGLASNKTTTDPALIADVLRTLRDGESVSLEVPFNYTNIVSVLLFSDQLPGLVFCPAVYIDQTGAVYVAENYAVEYRRTNSTVRARWVPASPEFTQWSQTR